MSVAMYIYEHVAALGSVAFCPRWSTFGNVRSGVQPPDGIDPVRKKERIEERVTEEV